MRFYVFYLFKLDQSGGSDFDIFSPRRAFFSDIISARVFRDGLLRKDHIFINIKESVISYKIVNNEDLKNFMEEGYK